MDTSGGACGVVLWQDGRVRARRDATMTHGHAEALAPMTRDTLAAAGATAAELAAVAVTVGPGSFTGLRVGLAFARGLGLATGRPVLGLPGPLVLAHMARAGAAAIDDGTESVSVVLDARRAEVFVQSFSPALAALGPVLSVSPDAVAAQLPARGPLCLTGDGLGLLPAPLLRDARLRVVDGASRPPDPAVLAALVADDPAAALTPRPVYGRPPDAAPAPDNPRAARPVP
nr:tRNA (adenosine(37)-N6)-threonylcarbamoyltransferase complex dimerization subunit type 1 TsaB [Roseospira visakhapatnamensis]